MMISIPKGKAHLPAKNIYELKEGRTSSLLASVFENDAAGWLPDNFSELQSGDRSIPAKALGQANNAKILLVDDNSDLREYIRRILSEKYIIITANNGRNALELIRGGIHPDLILADVMMPEMDGYGLLSVVRKNNLGPRIPFVMLTSKASEEARIEGKRQGVDDYLVKPFSSRELLARIDARIKIATIESSEGQRI